MGYKVAETRMKITPQSESPPSSIDHLWTWLVSPEGRQLDLKNLVMELAIRLEAAGLPLRRLSLSCPTLHPDILVRGVIWVEGQDVTSLESLHGLEKTPRYLNSPVYLLHQGAPFVRRRLTGPEAQVDMLVLEETAAVGATDYLALPIEFSRGQKSFVAFGARKPDGFSDQDIALLKSLLPFLTIRLELEAQRTMTADLLSTYLGRETGRRVLSGSFLRGQSESIDAAIWFSDLRGFTSLSERERPGSVIRMLDDYFETMVRPIQAADGEVLKFIGDGMLAIFRIEKDDAAAACRRALEASLAALRALENLNEGRALEGARLLRTGIALHRGAVMYGNVGARDRLDFTVIGRAVNEVARIENATSRLDRPLVTSAAFAQACEAVGCKLTSLGFHALKGVAEPQELFGLDEKR